MNDFIDPVQAPIRHRADKIAMGDFPVRVLNGSGKAGIADKVAGVLKTEGYEAEAAGNADSFGYSSSVVYAPADLQGWADAIAESVHPAVIRTVQRLPGTLTGITVIVGSQYTGQPPAEQHRHHQHRRPAADPRATSARTSPAGRRWPPRPPGWPS